jgi:hypothetical protein
MVAYPILQSIVRQKISLLFFAANKTLCKFIEEIKIDGLMQSFAMLVPTKSHHELGYFFMLNPHTGFFLKQKKAKVDQGVRFPPHFLDQKTVYRCNLSRAPPSLYVSAA